VSILTIIGEANGGRLPAQLADHVGENIADIEIALSKLIPEFAKQIKTKAEADLQDYEDLLDVVDDEEQINYLSNPEWSFSSDALEDGKQILNHLYGSVGNAQAAAGNIEISTTSKDFLCLTATFTIAAMASRNQALGLTGGADEDGDQGQQGLIAIIIAALLKGLMQALGSSFGARRRRRRRTYGRRRSTRRRRRSSSRRRSRRRRRRKKTPSLNDLIGDLFRG
jgi:hypothetical protein